MSLQWLLLISLIEADPGGSYDVQPFTIYNVELSDMPPKLTATLQLDALVRSIAINTARPQSLLLGAGASISSGMPSAERCIWEWKQDIFATNNPSLREVVGEISLSAARKRIQDWLDAWGGFPARDSDDEYSFYANACYPTPRDRRGFFQGYVTKAKPYLGYQLLPLLVRNDLIRTVWTTNFDGLPTRACAAANVECLEIGMDTQHRVLVPLGKGTLRVVSLHGDYRYDELKNTTEELQEQETQLRQSLIHDLKDHDLLVVGYSGRDSSLMAALHEAYSSPQAGRLYWAGMQSAPAPYVAALLALAQERGREAFYVPMHGFDDLIERLALRILRDNDLESAKAVLSAPDANQIVMGRFDAGQGKLTSLVKSNAYPLVTPSEVLSVELRIPSNEKPRRWLGQKMTGQQGAWVSTPTGALFLATSADIRQGLGEVLLKTPLALRISPEDIASDPKLMGLMRLGLVHSVAQTFGFDRNDRSVWETKEYLRKTIPQGTFALFKAVSFRLVHLKGQLHVLLTPEIIAKLPNGGVCRRGRNEDPSERRIWLSTQPCL